MEEKAQAATEVDYEKSFVYFVGANDLNKSESYDKYRAEAIIAKTPHNLITKMMEKDLVDYERAFSILHNMVAADKTKIDLIYEFLAIGLGNVKFSPATANYVYYEEFIKN